MMTFGLVILAAGASTRLGEPKQLLIFNEKSLLNHIVDITLDVNNTIPIIVLGAEKEKMEMELAQSNILIINNADWQDGMSSSVVAGLTKLLQLHPAIEGCLFTVCDQPFITAQLLNSLIAAYLQMGKGIVAAAYAGTVGTPVLFSKKYFTELLHLQRNQSAKQLLDKYVTDLASVPFTGGEIDIDTPEDYQKLIRGDL